MWFAAYAVTAMAFWIEGMVAINSIFDCLPTSIAVACLLVNMAIVRMETCR